MSDPTKIAENWREERFRRRVDANMKTTGHGTMGGSAVIAPLPTGRGGSIGERQPRTPPPDEEVISLAASEEVAASGTFLTWRAVSKPPERRGFAAFDPPSDEVPLPLPAGYTVSVEIDWHHGQGGVVEIWVGDDRHHVAQTGRTGNVMTQVTSSGFGVPLRVRTRHSGDPVDVSAKVTVELGRDLPDDDPGDDEDAPVGPLTTPDPPGVTAGSELGRAYLDATANAVTDATRYEFRAMHTTLGYSERAEANDPDVRIDGLEPLTEYAVAVRAYNDVTGATSDWSDDTTLETPGDESLPDTPTGFKVAAGFTTATATWEANTEADVRDGAGHYELEIADDDSGSPGATVDTAETSGTVTSFTGLTEGTDYHARIRAVDSSGNESAWSSWVAVTTAEADTRDFEIDPVLADELADGAVETRHLVDDAITEAKVAGDAITEAKIADAAVALEKIAADAVDASKLVSNAVTEAKIAADAVTSAKLADGSVVSTKIAEEAVGTTALVDDAITNAKIAANAVQSGNVASGAIATTHLVDDAITSAKIEAGAVIAGKVAADAIDTTNLVDDAITEAKIAADAVTSGKVAAGAITTAALVDDAITAAKIEAGAVGLPSLASGIRPIQIVETLPTLPDADYPPGAVVFNEADEKLYRNADDTWTAEVDTTDLSGTITETQVADDAISTPKLQANAVTAAKVTAGAIDTDHLAANAVTAGKIEAGAVDTDHLAANAVTAAKIEAGAITAGKIEAGAIDASHISAGAIETPALAVGAVVADRIAADAIDATHLAADAVTAGAIEAGAIEASHISANAIEAGAIAADAVTAGAIAASAVTTSALAADAVTAAKIDAGAITASHIAAGAVEAGAIAADAITTGKIAAGAVDTDELAADAVTAGKIDAGAIDASHISAGAIETAALDAGAVTAGKIAADAVTADKILAGEIGTTHLAADAVTAGKIDAGAIDATHISAGAIEVGAIAAGAVDTDALAADAVTAGKILAGEIGTDHLAADAVTATKIEAGTIDAGHLTAGIIETQHIATAGLDADVITTGVLDAGRILVGSGSAFDPGYDPATKEEGVVKQDTAPSSPDDGQLWVDTSTDPNVWRRWDASEEDWVKATPTDASEVGAETPAGAQAKANQALSDAETYADDEYGDTRAKVTLWEHTDATYIDGGMIATDTILANSILAGEIKTFHLDAEAVTANKIDVNDLFAASATLGQVNSDHIVTAGLDADVIKFGTMSGDRIEANSLDVNRLTSGSLESSIILLGSGGVLMAGTLQDGVIIGDDGIRMQSGGSGSNNRKVYIPVSGDPEFTGIIHAEGGDISGNLDVNGALSAGVFTIDGDGLTAVPTTAVGSEARVRWESSGGALRGLIRAGTSGLLSLQGSSQTLLGTSSSGHSYVRVGSNFEVDIRGQVGVNGSIDATGALSASGNVRSTGGNMRADSFIFNDSTSSGMFYEAGVASQIRNVGTPVFSHGSNTSGWNSSYVRGPGGATRFYVGFGGASMNLSNSHTSFRTDIGGGNSNSIHSYALGNYTSGGSANVHMSGSNNLSTSTSSLRFKKDVEPLDVAVARKVMNLRPIWYRGIAPADNGHWSYYGLAAEDVAEIDRRLVHWKHKDGDDAMYYYEECEHECPEEDLIPNGVAYDRIPMLMLPVVQDHDREIQALRKAVEDLAGRVGAPDAARGFPDVGRGIETEDGDGA